MLYADVEGHCLVKNWLVCANSRPPVVTKAFEQVIRLSEMVVNKVRGSFVFLDCLCIVD